MTDDDDKTVFTPGQRQVQQDAADSTMFVPKPGTARSAPPPQPSAAAKPQVAVSAPLMMPAALPSVQLGLNYLVSAASTLLAVMSKLRNTVQHADVAGLHRTLVDEIKQFDARLKNQNARPEIALAARYQLCAAMDEAVMNTPWGAQAGWAQRSMLSLFHKETSGGEKFFAILAKMMDAPGSNLEIIELDYLLLSMGFEGKYRIDARGRDHIETMRDNLYNTIEKLRGNFEPDLSPHGSSTIKTQKSLTEFLPLWVAGAIALGLMLLVFAVFRIWIFQATEPTADRIETVIESVTKTNNK